MSFVRWCGRGQADGERRRAAGMRKRGPQRDKAGMGMVQRRAGKGQAQTVGWP